MSAGRQGEACQGCGLPRASRGVARAGYLGRHGVSTGRRPVTLAVSGGWQGVWQVGWQRVSTA
jgi:hypothetical protein